MSMTCNRYCRFHPGQDYSVLRCVSFPRACQLGRRSLRFELSNVFPQLSNFLLGLGHAVLEFAGAIVSTPTQLLSSLIKPTMLSIQCFAGTAGPVDTNAGFMVQQPGSTLLARSVFAGALFPHVAPFPVTAGIVNDREEAHGLAALKEDGAVSLIHAPGV